MVKTKAEMLAELKAMGVSRTYKPIWEAETETILLDVRKPYDIVETRLKGCQIDVYDGQTFRVWTAQTKMANAIAQQHGLRIRHLDGECELFVRADVADEILPRFRVKIKWPATKRQMDALKMAWQQTANDATARSSAALLGVPGVLGAGNE